MVVGLGNPGKEYEATRHNTGRMVLEHIRRAEMFSPWELDSALEALRCDGVLEDKPVRLLLPETYMNNSGKSVKKALEQEENQPELIVVYDDIDLPLGSMRISYDRSSGGHHGIDSIMEALGTRAFLRIRIGIAGVFDGVARKPQGEKAVIAFLMKPFTLEEKKTLAEVGERVGEALRCIVTRGREYAMSSCSD